jgi:signal peptidase I
MKTIIRDVLITLAIALAIFFALRATVQAYKVRETCMEPNYVEGEWILVSKASYWWGDPQRGDEPYVKEAPAYTFPLKELGEDEYFVLGDNRNNANDSHTGWTITRDDIIGKAWFSYWPTSEWGGANNYPLDEQLEAPDESSP